MGIHPEPYVRRRIALIAHDNKKIDIAEWARFNRALLVRHDLCATRTTGELFACNRASADFMIFSPLFARRYDRMQPDFA